MFTFSVNQRGERVQIESMKSVDFEAELKCVAGTHLKVTCKVRLPSTGWDGAFVAIELPHTNIVLQMRNPSQVRGIDRYGRTITLDGVYYRSINIEPGRTAGFAPMEIQHIDRLQITGLFPNEAAARNLQLTLGAHKFLSDVQAKSIALDESMHAEELFSLDLPSLGPVTFYRVWEIFRSVDRLNATAACAFRLAIQNHQALPHPDRSASTIRHALTVPSIFWRQRVCAIGWSENNSNGERVEAWDQPLEPVKTTSAAVAPNQGIAHRDDLHVLLESALRNFSNLDVELQRAIELMSLGLVPFVAQQHAQRFLTMFHALEACRRFASKEPSPEVQVVTDDLLEVLRTASISSDGSLRERLNGIIEGVAGGPRVDLKIQLEEMMAKWNVHTADIWPIVGPASMPGLKQIRDTLAHKGSTAVNGRCLVVAAYHLSVLLERIVLALLDIPLQETDIAPERVGSSEWFDRQYVDDLRARILKKLDS